VIRGASSETSKLDRKTPFAIQWVSQTQFSIARHYGGIKFNGFGYIYFPEHDELIRDDVLGWLKKHRKAQKKVGAGDTAVQGDMLLTAI